MDEPERSRFSQIRSATGRASGGVAARREPLTEQHWGYSLNVAIAVSPDFTVTCFDLMAPVEALHITL